MKKGVFAVNGNSKFLDHPAEISCIRLFPIVPKESISG